MDNPQDSLWLRYDLLPTIVSESPGARLDTYLLDLPHLKSDKEAQLQGDHGKRDADTRAYLHLCRLHLRLPSHPHHYLHGLS